MVLQKKTAVITGASSGIGYAISEELARYGYQLLMVSNEEEKIIEAAGNLENKYGVTAIPLYMDLAKIDSAQMLFEYCNVNNIIAEILINNAGIFFFKDITDTPVEQVQTVLNLHIHTPAMLSLLFSQQMIKEGRKGYIMNMASISSRMMMPGITLYSSTKSFLRCFSRSMRNEVFNKGISITTISPGAVATNLYSLSDRLIKLGIFFGVIIPAQRLAKQAVRKMFRRKAEFIPGGFINRLFIFLVNILPERSVRRIKRKIDDRLQKK